jgi:hypothetical protein
MFFVFILGFVAGCWFTNSFPDIVSENIQKTKKFIGVDNGSKEK